MEIRYPKEICAMSRTLFISLLLIIFFIIDPKIFAQSLHFIHNGPVKMIPGTPKVFYEARIYRFDEDTKHMEQVWTLGQYREAQKIGVYSTPRRVLISNNIELNIIPMDSVDQVSTIKPENMISDYHYYHISNAADVIEIRELTPNKDVAHRFHYELLSVDGMSNPYPSKGTYLPGIIRLCGVHPSGCNEHDLIGFHELPEGKITISPGFVFDAVPVPDSIIQLGSTRGWNLITNEPDFYALVSVPDRSSLTHRELLIYNRISKNWKSILIEGGVTGPRLINGWLVGDIKDINPESDYENHKVYPAVFRGYVVLINPLEGHQFSVNLGFGGTVLWVEDAMVYYKTVDRSDAYLYKARIENDSFVDKELLSTEPVVRYFRWAFRGKRPEEVEYKKME